MAESQVGLLPHLGANVYKVDRILTHKRTKAALRERVKYLVQWHGYGSDQWSWLSKADFVMPAHIKTFSIVKCIWKECQILRFRSKNRTGVVDFEL